MKDYPLFVKYYQLSSICQCMFIDPDKSKHIAILFQYILRGYSNIDMLAYQVRINY